MDKFIQEQKIVLEEKLVRYLEEWPQQRNPPVHLALKQRKPVEYIRRALQKITEGSYGVCDDCEEIIPRKRLESVSGAIRCVECESDL